MTYVVWQTRVAERQVRGLRGARAAAYVRFEQTLAERGCAALAYRLTGRDPLPRICVQHLRGSDRALVAFESGEAWVLLVGPHDAGDAARDVCRTLYGLAGVDIPIEPRTKPPCCDEDGQPPTLDTAAVDDLVTRARALRR